MAIHDMLDDCQPEARAHDFAAFLSWNPIKSLCEPGKVLAGNPAPAVRDPHTDILILMPALRRKESEAATARVA